MKTALIALAFIATGSIAAQAGDSSFSDGSGPEVRPYANATGVDYTATASIGASGEVHRDQVYDNGQDFSVLYTLNADGSRNVLSKSRTSSNN